MTTKESRIQRGILYLAVAAIMVLLVCFPVPQNPYQSLTANAIRYERGVVVSVLNEELSPSSVEASHQLGMQTLEVALESGTTIQVDNYLTDVHNVLAKAGSHIIVCVDAPEGVEPYYTVYNYDRTVSAAMLVCVFLGLMLLVGRRKGFDAALAILFSMLILLQFTLPLIYNGASPVAVGLASVLASTAVTLTLLYGLTARAWLSAAVTLAGECTAVALFAGFAFLLHISGFQTDPAESLIVVAQNTGLRLKSILLTATMIASLGAVMDVAVSLLSALWELRVNRPGLSASELFRSGMNIGRDMIGTMSNTLIFAFAGSALATMLSLFAYGVQSSQLLNSDYVSMELAQGLCSTCAVIATVPLASLAAAVVFPKLKIPGEAPV
ncbi:YibE/F family protein [Oscillibacter hominis]|uniref:YibE/F family protein n=1 Tax=Oscillibacter hominis TaxID=2763056 RepID=A0A7G9B644_9FIRM|nr:YibE/F family protein [Oscillibacter hominis]QNL45025.1 YibE/F family protein [Oscillibacter hominis]